ncbi:lipopolysaccharide biosynthesis protein [Jannaschia sp. R86511]|uniref:lipopolysaccharide biosynthesis protein n=1 Tax=Jannaschia sp. R86511 TaxID=3093853 RepID=UPI0036D3D015
MTADAPAPAPVGAGQGRGRFARATAWAFVMDAGGQVATLAVSVVLAAVLGPAAYGLVAMALVYVMFIQLIQQQGMQAAVIQRADLDERHKSTAFWLVLVTSLVLTGLSVLLAGWWSAVNRTPELEPILVALSALLPIRALSTVQEAVVRRSMRFRALAVRTLVSVLLGGAAGLWAAFAGLGAWALVVQQLVTAALGCILLWSVSHWRPRLTFSGTAARELFGFSTGSFVSSIGVFVNNKADALLIGIFFGPLVVGLYRFAARLVETLLAVAVRPVQSVALPGLSQHQHDQVAFDRRSLQLRAASGWLALPALGLLMGSAPIVVELLGEEWSSAVWPLRLLCLVGMIRVLVTLDGPMLQARGRVHVQAAATWVAALASAGSFTVAALLLRDSGVVAQATGVAAARLAVYGVVVLAIHVWLVRRVSRTRWRTVLACYAPAAATAVLCFVAATTVQVVGDRVGWSLLVDVLLVAGLGVLALTVVLHQNRTVLQTLRNRPGERTG